MVRLPAFSLVLLSFVASLLAQPASSKPSEADAAPVTILVRTASMTHMPGLLTLHWDSHAGKLFLEVPMKANPAHTRSAEILYAESLPWGIGSNDLGLDRGQVSAGIIVRFEREGPKLLLVEPNLAFRSSSSSALEQLSIQQSFPESILAGFKIEAEAPDGTVLIDATEFFLRDAHHVSDTLAAAKQGSYRVDSARSAIILDQTGAFPNNTEVEAELTFASDDPHTANFVSDVTPDPHSITVREHQSFIQLPGPGFTPRRFSPRAGYFPMTYRDYDAPLGDPLDQNFIIRHRLIKRDPSCTHACAAVKPIQYYVDTGTPEPIRSALIEGARWWDAAFQEAGWAPGTFRVDALPEGDNPLDIRYNMIEWVHRYTRGWSYGGAITDPRTGEILKGTVTLGSLRGRQDYLIAEALLSPYVTGKSIKPQDDPMLQFVLARIRQLAAHETGHTLGLAHNFAASSFPHSPSETVSVMDYPHPYVTLSKDGVPDISNAYPTHIGSWDKVAIDYGYREFDADGKPTEDTAALDSILRTSEKTGLIFITDEDARPIGSAHPHAHLWDNGTDPAAELERVLNIRAAALARFGENAIKTGTPMAQLEETLVPLYLFHRYQTEAAIKEIGGLDYRYNLRGDGQMNPTILDPVEQKKAITAVLRTLEPQTLTLPESILAVLPPHPPALSRTRESLPSHTGLTFDPIGAAEAAADLTLKVLLDPARASRIIEYHMRVTTAPSLRVMLESISKTTAERPEAGHSISSEIERAVEFRALEAMLSLAVNPEASSQARAITRSNIADVLKQMTSEPAPQDSAEAIHRTAFIERIQEFEKAPEKFVPVKTIEAPPGMPIGDDED